MNTAWTKNLSSLEDKASFEKQILGSKTVLDRLSVILDELSGDLTDKELSEKIYESPSWAYRQAHLNGVKATINKIKTLICLDQTQG